MSLKTRGWRCVHLENKIEIKSIFELKNSSVVVLCGLSSQSLCSHFIRTGVSTSKLKVEDDYNNAKGFLYQKHNCGTGKAEKQPTDSTNLWTESKTIIWETVQIVLLHENSFTLNGELYFGGWEGGVLHGGSSLSKQHNFKELSSFTEFYIKAIHKASHDFYVAA